MLVGGERGVGKTRLIADFGVSLGKSRTRIAVGHCLAFAQRPYAPILEILRRLEPDDASSGASTSERADFDAMAAALRRAAARQTLLMVVEDLHLADAGTLKFLEHIAPQLRSLRILLVGSYRSDTAEPQHPTRDALRRQSLAPATISIALAPFDRTQAHAFIAEALGDASLPDRTVAAIAGAADGNPFFILELLKSTLECGSSAPSVAAHALPRSILAAVGERLRFCNARERHVLAHAALLGHAFSRDMLASVLEVAVDSLQTVLERARERHILAVAGDGEFRFCHALTREVLYGEFLQLEIRAIERQMKRPAEQRTWIAHSDAIDTAGPSAAPAAPTAPAAQRIPTHAAVVTADVLSSRELEVASYVALGCANLEIARTLAISHKTVEKHLASIYGKLGIASRTLLARRMSGTAQDQRRLAAAAAE